MAIGPGKYDHLAAYVREQAGVTNGGVIVIVVGGKNGPGFSVQADLETSLSVPDLLEAIARDIRADMARY